MADHTWAQLKNGTIGLGFATRTLGREKQLAAKLEVRLPVEWLPWNLFGPGDEFFDKLRKFVDSRGKLALRPPVEDWVFEGTTNRDTVEWATLVRMAHFGSDAQLDFYQLTIIQVTDVVHKLRVGNFDVVPLVRVSLTASELLALLIDARKVGEQVGLLKAT